MILLAGTLILSLLFCGVYLRFAQARHILDAPNDRSSHVLPTPHGGGAPLFLAFALAQVLAVPVYGAWHVSYGMLTAAALVLVCLGLMDDLRGLSVRLRLTLYGTLCLGVAAFLLHELTASPVVQVALILPAALGMLWLLNLYNFMDGIDGIAALQTLLASTAAAWLSYLSSGDEKYALYCLLLGAAHGGFLIWNFPPARLFLGDAGSIPTGFLLAGVALLGAVQGQLNPLCWMILLAVFITDASWTLLWRIFTGQAFIRPHKLHAYQRLSRKWQSHLKVDALLLAINLFWLIPLAFAVQYWAQFDLFLVFLAYLPLLCAMAKLQGLP